MFKKLIILFLQIMIFMSCANSFAKIESKFGNKNQKNIQKTEELNKKNTTLSKMDEIFYLGVLKYQQGELEEAEKYLKQAADLGKIAAIFNLGVLKNDQGLLAEAEAWYKKAADLGHKDAAHNLELLKSK